MEPSAEKLTVVISGANGLIGRALVNELKLAGHSVLKLSRTAGSLESDEIAWSPASGITDTERLEGADAVIHLAGKSLVGRWSEKNKHEFRQSRVGATEALVRSLGQMRNPPRVFICASAIGIYGDRADDQLTESSPSGSGFLAELCADWESQALRASKVCERAVSLRIALVLSKESPAIKKMLLPFRLGFGGKLGSGKQYTSWITLEDAVRSIMFVLQDGSISGAVNLSAPEPVTNSEFTRALARAVKRPAFFAVPEFALRMLVGEQADALLLSSARVLPSVLMEHGFTFKSENVKSALERVLQK